MGIAPNVWGPPTWSFLHLMVMAEKEPLDTARLIYYKQFYTVLTHLLPCDKCRNHLLENLSQLPDITTMKTKRELFDWTTQLHNKVNSLTSKATWTYDAAFQHWKNIAEGKKVNQPNAINYWKFVAIALVVVIVFSMWSKRRRS